MFNLISKNKKEIVFINLSIFIIINRCSRVLGLNLNLFSILAILFIFVITNIYLISLLKKKDNFNIFEIFKRKRLFESFILYIKLKNKLLIIFFHFAFILRKSLFEILVYLSLFFGSGYWFFQFFLYFGEYVDFFLGFGLLIFSLYNAFYNQFVRPLLPEINTESSITLASIFAILKPKIKYKDNYPLEGITWQKRGLFGSAAVRAAQAKIGEATLGTLITSGVAVAGMMFHAYGVKRNNDILEETLKAQQQQAEILKKQAEEQNIADAEPALAKLNDTWFFSSNQHQKQVLEKRIDNFKNKEFIEKVVVENKLEIKIPEINSCLEEKYFTVWDLFISFISFLKKLFF